MSILSLYSFQKLHMIENNLRQMRRFKSTRIDFRAPVVQKYFNYLVLQNESLLSKDHRSPKELNRLYEIKPIVNVLVQKIFLQANIDFLNEQRKDAHDELVKQMIGKETEIYVNRIKVLENQIQSALFDPILTHSGVVLEIDVNEGKEGSQFAQELLDMYKSYAQYKGWGFDVASLDESTHGLKNVSVIIEGFGAHELMNVEVGKHHRMSPEKPDNWPDRVSTVSVTVIPIPTELQYDIPSEDITIETKQDLNQNSKEIPHSSVRVTHTPSDTTVECKQNNSNIINERIAMKKLRAVLYEVVKVCDLVDENGEVDAFAKKQETVRTYDHSEDKVVDSREGAGEQFQLKTFLTDGEHLGRLQNNLLRNERYRAVINDIRKFNKKSNSGKDDVFTLF